MTTSNEQILSAYIRHQIYVINYAGGLRNETWPYLSGTDDEIGDLIIKYLAKLEGSRTLLKRNEQKLLRELDSEIAEIRHVAWAKVTSEVDKQIKEFAMVEAMTGATVIETSVPVVLNMVLPPSSQLNGIVNSQPFEGRTLKQWMQRTEEADVQRILRNVKIGIVQGQTPTQVAREIVGTPTRRDGTTRKAFRDLETVLLTVTNGVQQDAKQALYAQNSDIISREQFVATLDSRTTLVCISNDTKTFERGKGPIPPLHMRCRSLRVPYIDPNMLGDRPFNPTTEKQLLREYGEQANIGTVRERGSLPYGHKTKFDEFARKRKRELIGGVPARMSYQEFLKQQSNEFQDEVLGPTRAKMFREGNLSLDRFVARDGDTLTLDELKAKGLDVPGVN